MPKKLVGKNFTIEEASYEEKIKYLHSHLGSTLLEIVEIRPFSATCKVKCSEGEKVFEIYLPARYKNSV